MSLFVIELIRETTTKKSMPLIEHWELAYSPKNIHFDKLIEQVVKDLKLDGYIGAENATALEGVLVSRKIVAGIEFQHEAVSFRQFSKSIHMTLHSSLLYSPLQRCQKICCTHSDSLANHEWHCNMKRLSYSIGTQTIYIHCIQRADRVIKRTIKAEWFFTIRRVLYLFKMR